MTTIRIVTDSTADIPLAVRQSLGIEMVPLKVHFGNETYLDSVTLHADEFYERLPGSPALPTTSQPSPVDFVDTFKKLTAQPDTHVISIHLSSAMSGTYQSAVLAKSLIEDNENITIIDSKTASYGCGMLAVEAAKAAQAGSSVEQVFELIQDIRETTSLFFLVDTLEFLQKGGRIGKASALFGSLLNIKPILSIDGDGEIVAVDKVRGQKKAMGRIADMLHEVHNGHPVIVDIAHSKADAAVQEFSGLLKQRFDVKALNTTTLGPVIGTHVGPGTMAVFMREAK